MKILYICPNNAPDYQCDLIFIGLRNLFGESIVDLNRIDYLYRDYSGNLNSLYGRGFTYTNTIDAIEVDRNDIESKIRNKYFDKIVYGSIHRNRQYINDVLTVYNKKDIIFIDGEDLTDDYNNRGVITPLLGRGYYFKRENHQNIADILPIQFCIPRYKIANNVSKSKTLASYVPGSTYQFTNEQDYYNEYKRSVFAITTKKSGWDCLRHYEILGNGCIPVFDLLHNREENALTNCPVNIMHMFPKSIVIQLTHIYKNNIKMSADFFLTMCDILLNYTKNYLTCESYCEKYFLNVIK